MIAFFVLGKLIIWVLQTSEIFDPLRKMKYLGPMLECDFCTGFWVYSILALLYRRRGTNVLASELPKVPILTQFLEGLIASFVMHLFSQGWKDRFNA